MNWISKVIEIIKLPAKFILAIAIFTGSLLLLPRELTSRLKLQPLLDNYGPYLGIAFYAALVLLLTSIVFWFAARIRNKREINKEARAKDSQRNAFEQRVLQKIQSLDPHEKALLREFIIQGKNTIELPLDDTIVSGLIHAGILSQVGQFVTRNILLGVLSSVSLSAAASKLLTLESIDLPKGTPSSEQKAWVLSQRPEVVLRIEHFNEMYKR